MASSRFSTSGGYGLRTTSRFVSRVVSSCALALSLAATAGASSFVMVSDEDLAAGAAHVVLGSVTGIDRGSNGGYHTDYAVRVDTVLRGEDPGPAVMVRVIGGEGPAGDELRVVGEPRMSVGDQTILFLEPERDGAYALYQYFLGVFRRVERGGEAVAVRDFGGAEEIRLPGGRIGSEANVERDFDAFAEWLSAGGVQGEDEPEYLREATEPGIGRIESAFTSISDGAVRWFEFDRGGFQTYFADARGLQGSAADVFGMTARVLQAWSTVEGSTVRLRYGGKTQIQKGFASSDRINGILWDDPFGEVSGRFDCERGGVVAIGGVKRSTRTQSFANGSALQIIEGDVVVNDGAACFFERNGGLDGEEVLGHELGHTLGFGHSKDKAALMWATARGNGRGCALGADDIAGLYFLYPGAAGLTVRPGALTLESAAYSAVEGAAVTLTVHRTNGSTGAASARLRTKNGTAKAPGDFVAFDQTLTWGNGDAAPKSVTLSLLSDANQEPVEKLRVELVGVAGAEAGAIQVADVTVADAKAPSAAGGGRAGQVGFAVASTTIEEGGTVTLVVERTGGAGGAVSATWRAVDASAKAGADYRMARGVVRWGAGDTSPKQIRIESFDDRVAEGTESFLVKFLRATGGATLSDRAATVVKIQDDDQR